MNSGKFRKVLKITCAHKGKQKRNIQGKKH